MGILRSSIEYVQDNFIAIRADIAIVSDLEYNSNVS